MAAPADMWIVLLTFVVVFVKNIASIHFEDVPGVEVMHKREMEATADARCVLCKFVMEEIDGWLTGPVVKNYLKEEFTPTCKKYIPLEADKVCHAIVDVIDDGLSELVFSELSPNTACSRVKMCPKGTTTEVREATLTKMPHSSENFLCGLCKDMTKSAIRLSATVLDKINKEVIEYCEEHSINIQCNDLAHDLIHNIQAQIKAGPLSHQHMCIDSLKAC